MIPQTAALVAVVVVCCGIAGGALIALVRALRPDDHRDACTRADAAVKEAVAIDDARREKEGDH